MKRTVAILVGILLVIAVVVGTWGYHLHPNPSKVLSSAPAAGDKPLTTHPFVSSFVQPAELKKFQADREATMTGDADVASAYKALLDEMAAQQKELDAAMLKADPKVGPALARLELVRKHTPAPDSTAAAPKMITLTPAEWQEIQAARLAALKADPQLDVKAKELAVRMQAFQQQVEAAMVKGDPSLAPVLAKFQTGPSVPQPEPRKRSE